MDSFAFIPRAVKKRGEPARSTPKAPSKPTTTQASVSSLPKASSDGQAHLQAPSRASLGQGSTEQLNNSNPTTLQPVNTIGSQTYDQVNLQEMAALVCLAISDYSLWSDSDLRRKIDIGGFSMGRQAGSDDLAGTEDPDQEDTTGYIPMTYILKHSSIFQLCSPVYRSYPPTLYVKALRTHASDIVNVRLVLSPGTGLHGRSRGPSTTLHDSGYEIKRKSQPELLLDMQSCGKRDWDERTLYMENIPPAYRTVVGIIQLVSGLISSETSEPHVLTRLQNIAYPLHHKDKAGDVPTCKGFALVTLAQTKDIELLLEEYPWNYSTITSKEDETSCKLQKEARKFGLRMMSKQKWEGLKAEYLIYRQRLVEEINRFQDHAPSVLPAHAPNITDKSEAYLEPPSHSTTKSSSTSSGLNVDDPYPHGCLVFMRNVHPDTNKTTLRALFNRMLANQGDSTLSTEEKTGIDYVDYNKGMESCFLRLRTPAHASYLVQEVNSGHVYQQSGLDVEGGPPSNSTSPSFLQAELILGTREELYWNKVPERVRRQAVQRAIEFSSTHATEVTAQQAVVQKRNDLLISQASYPPNCLVFVRNVHIETNKTTLKTLFTNFLHQSLENGIDYVDYNKGTDTCYLRFCTPSSADQLVGFINSSDIVQRTGLDGEAFPGQGLSTMKAELVTGKREELYWERLPEKVRKQAVEKAISCAVGDNRGGDQMHESSSQRKRKREKRA